MAKEKKQLNEEEQLFLDSQLRSEIIENEKKRSMLLGVISLIIILLIVGLVFVFNNQLIQYPVDIFPVYITLVVFAIMVARAAAILFMLQKDKMRQIVGSNKRGEIVRYGWLLLEISVPSVLLYFYSDYMADRSFVFMPVKWYYILVIILSTLSLDFWKSFFCGFVAAFQFSIIIFWFTKTSFSLEPVTIANSPVYYISYIILLFISGNVAGFVAYQLKKKITNTYIALLERNRVVNLFDQQVSKEIVDELIANYDYLAGKRKFVCVMFLDIRNFTQFTEKMQPEEIIDYQNKIFSFMIEIITKNHGVINQFLGDGYMATFGAPISKGNDCLNAVTAAFEIIKSVNEKSERGEIPKTKIGIGLHAGDIVAGNVGTSIRKQYSISGSTVILASRIEDLTKQYSAQLLVSKEVLENADGIDCTNEYLGEIVLKGRETPMKIYKLI